MDLFSDLSAQLGQALAEVAASAGCAAALSGLAPTFSLSKHAAQGEITTNAALLVSGKAGGRPARPLATALAAALERRLEVERSEVAGPGFVNLWLKPSFWQQVVPAVLTAGADYGCSALGAGRQVNIEFVSANPTGPLTVAHGRGAVLGDTLAHLMHKVGYRVTREYYVNDAGGQIALLARALHLRYRSVWGEEITDFPEDLYPGAYLIPVAEALAARDGRRWLSVPQAQWQEPLALFASEKMLHLIREDLAALRVHHDIFSSERSCADGDGIEKALAVLRAQDLIYTGVLPPPQGLRSEDWQARPQLLFRATAWGDEQDRALGKADGSWTYFAGDLAYHHNKIARGYDLLINVLGADHEGYQRRIQAGVAALSRGEVQLAICSCQLVRLLRGGRPVRMSKRSGQFARLRDLIDEVGADAVRFLMLMRKSNTPLDFDLEQAVAKTLDNPLYYVQYAHARCASVLRRAPASFPQWDMEAKALALVPCAGLVHPLEVRLLRLLALWPGVVREGAENCEVHRLASYAQDLAAAFHSSWSVGTGDDKLRFLDQEQPHLSHARLALCLAIRQVLRDVLGLLGVTAMDELR